MMPWAVAFRANAVVTYLALKLMTPRSCDQNVAEGRSTCDISSVNPGRSMRFTLFDNPEALPVDYRDIHVSDKVVRIIQSYTKIVNEMIWRK
jgi:hypothetical protein